MVLRLDVVCVSFLCLCVSQVAWVCFFFFKQKTAYEMRISDWSSDVCSSDLSVTPSDVADATGLPVMVTIPFDKDLGRSVQRGKIGRASRRERVCQYV